MARLFNAYVIVDWSAAESKATGKNSIWIGVVKRDVPGDDRLTGLTGQAR